MQVRIGSFSGSVEVIMNPRAVGRTGLAILLGVVLATTLACATPRGRVYVRAGPPAPLAEVRPAAPGPAYVWIAGYYRWNGRAYVWTPGRWAARPSPRAVWVPARWVHDRRGWYIIEGHWRRIRDQ